MLSRVFHAWERRLASKADDRVVRPFEWGLDWIDADGRSPGTAPDAALAGWVANALGDSDRFFAIPPVSEYRFSAAAGGGVLQFPSALRTPHPENNTVYARYFHSACPGGRRRAVVVLPQWNAGPDGHVPLCRLLTRFGLTPFKHLDGIVLSRFLARNL